VVRANLLPVLDEAEQVIDTYEGHSADLLRDFIFGWWERIGDTPLSGLAKLMMAESGNFPEVAKFYHDEIISRSDALVIRMLERGMARGEFRRVDAARAHMVIVAPVLMLTLWKHSFDQYRAEPIPVADYLATVVDMMMHGLVAADNTSLPTDKPC
jgi:hypothetical protein